MKLPTRIPSKAPQKKKRVSLLSPPPLFTSRTAGSPELNLINVMADLSTSRLLAVASLLLAFGALGFYSIDGMISSDASGNPLINAFYCSAITLTTVGYGDICPSDNMSPLGRLFIITLSFSGLGMFCGPVMDYSASWKERIPGGVLSPGLFALFFGTILFRNMIDDMDWHSAMYFTIITGTTVGYGDISAKTDYGRLATAIFAILAVNVIGGILEPAKEYLSTLCMVPPKAEVKIKSTTPGIHEDRAKQGKKKRKRKKKKKKS